MMDYNPKAEINPSSPSTAVVMLSVLVFYHSNRKQLPTQSKHKRSLIKWVSKTLLTVDMFLVTLATEDFRGPVSSQCSVELGIITFATGSS